MIIICFLCDRKELKEPSQDTMLQMLLKATIKGTVLLSIALYSFCLDHDLSLITVYLTVCLFYLFICYFFKSNLFFLPHCEEGSLARAFRIHSRPPLAKPKLCSVKLQAEK